jgi:hypothetical protein
MTFPFVRFLPSFFLICFLFVFMTGTQCYVTRYFAKFGELGRSEVFSVHIMKAHGEKRYGSTHS